MRHIIDYAKGIGLTTLWGITLRDNARMQRLARQLGFTVTRDPDDATLARLNLALR